MLCPNYSRWAQIKSVKFSPCLQLTGFISGEHSGDCDVIVTAGERNLKFWSFQRPVSSSLRGSSLESKKFRLGKLTVEAAKVFTCVEFTSPRNTVSRSTDSTSNGGRPGSSGRPSSTTLGVDTSIGLCDVVTGGDNGFLYLWRQGLCVKAVRVIPNEGSLDCLQIHRAAYGEDLIFCGGSGKQLLL